MNKDTEAKLAVEYFKTANESFSFQASYNFSKITTETNEKYYFHLEHKNLKLLGLSSQIKSEVSKKVDKSVIQIFLPLLHSENSHVYDTKPTKTAWEYDLNTAYTHWLHLLWVSEKLYYKMLDIKRKFNFNINQSIGMALLGEKIIAKYRHGKPSEREVILNPLRPCFYLLRYLTITTLKRVLAIEAKKIRIAYYVDAIILTEKANKLAIESSYNFQAFEVLQELETKSLKYYNNSIFKSFGIDIERVTSILYNRNYENQYFTFKERQINDVNIYRHEFTNKKVLEFRRENELITYK
jgi:hypothetical protein